MADDAPPTKSIAKDCYKLGLAIAEVAKDVLVLQGIAQDLEQNIKRVLLEVSRR